MEHSFRKGLTKGRWGRARMAHLLGVSVGTIHSWFAEVIPAEDGASNEGQFFLAIACAMLHQTGAKRHHMQAAVGAFQQEPPPQERWKNLALVRQGDELFWMTEGENLEAWVAWEAHLLNTPYCVLPVGRRWADAHAKLEALLAGRVQAAKRS